MRFDRRANCMAAVTVQVFNLWQVENRAISRMGCCERIGGC